MPGFIKPWLGFVRMWCVPRQRDGHGQCKRGRWWVAKRGGEDGKVRARRLVKGLEKREIVS